MIKKKKKNIDDELYMDLNVDENPEELMRFYCSSIC